MAVSFRARRTKGGIIPVLVYGMRRYAPEKRKEGRPTTAYRLHALIKFDDGAQITQIQKL